MTTMDRLQTCLIWWRKNYEEKQKLPDNEITVYQAADGNINIEVLYANENVWLTQKRMAELFGCTADNISLHLKNIYEEKELDEKATTEDFSVVQQEEVIRDVLPRYNPMFYNKLQTSQFQK